MKPIIKSILFFGSGLLAGGGLGVFGARCYYRKKYAEILDQELLAMEERFGIADQYRRSVDESLDELFGSDEAVNEETNTGREFGPGSERSKDTNSYQAYRPEEIPHVDYRRFYKSDAYEGEPDEIEEKEEAMYEAGLDMKEDYKKNCDRPPRIISVDDLSELPNHTDHVILNYFCYDDTLTDEDGNLEDNPETLLGNCLHKYGFSDVENEESVIFVMNYALDTVYEVQKFYAAFEQYEV